MKVNVDLSIEEAMGAIRALETVPWGAQDRDVRRSVRDKLANAVDTLVRDDASGEVLRQLHRLDERTK